MSGNLAGRRVLVTGSTRGTGLAIARRLIADGAKVVINSEKDDEDARSARAELQTHYIKADVGNREQCRTLVEATVKRLDGLDLLINCAAFVDLVSLSDASDRFIDRTLEVNIRGPILVCRAALPYLQKAASDNRESCIVNVGSGSGIEGHSMLTIYSASKGGLHSFTRALSRELKGTGIRCNAVLPGWLENAVPDDEADRSWAAWHEYLHRCPLERAGRVEEVAAVVALVASREFSYVNGQLILVDGGAM